MNNNRRIFIGINFKNQFKKELTILQNKIEYQFGDVNPIKWTRESNLHLTLLFIGYLRDEDLMDVFKITENIAKNFEKFAITFDKADYFPFDKEAKKMVFVLGEKKPELIELNQQLKKGLINGGKSAEFIPHITLGRINQMQYRKINPEEIPQLKNEEINLITLVESIDVMESELKKGGAQYTILKSFNLN